MSRADGRLRCASMRQQASPLASPVTLLVEHYWPMVDEALLRASLPRLETAVGAMRSAGHRIDHLGFLLVPTDQVAFSVIRASSEAIAREVYSRAHVRVDRIAAVTPVGFDLRDAPVTANLRVAGQERPAGSTNARAKRAVAREHAGSA
jgi:hypothetical protein